MSVARRACGFLYRTFVKPILFLFDAEAVHDATLRFGAATGQWSPVRSALRFDRPALEQTIDGIVFRNPVGLAAGFDYNGLDAGIFSNVGFGFNTAGTVTALPCAGNKEPRLMRLPESRAILVNKGFKSDGAEMVARRLDAMELTDATLGISVGSSNIPAVDSIEKAVADYCITFKTFRNRRYVKYFELNVSCPNTAMPEPFTGPDRFGRLCAAVAELGIAQPVWIKMPSDLAWEKSDELMRIALRHGMRTFIFSNLAKGRTGLAEGDRRRIAYFRGNVSGKPVERQANDMISQARRAYGDDVTIVGCGGVFSARDAYEKITRGARLIQLITGMIFQGPQLAGEINEGIAAFLKQDGCASVAEAVGKNATQ